MDTYEEKRTFVLSRVIEIAADVQEARVSDEVTLALIAFFYSHTQLIVCGYFYSQDMKDLLISSLYPRCLAPVYQNAIFSGRCYLSQWQPVHGSPLKWPPCS